MDGLSVAASIIAVVQIAGSVITYLSAVKNAPKECRKLLIEVSNSITLLLKLKDLSESSPTDPWSAEVQAFAVKDGPLDQYKLVLENLIAKVKPQTGVRKAVNVLLWSFLKEEVTSILVRMESLKTLMSIALEMDQR
jgi:hypothetical protein